MRTAMHIAVITVMAQAAMWAADIITRPLQRPVKSSLPPASSTESNAARSARLIATPLVVACSDRVGVAGHGLDGAADAHGILGVARDGTEQNKRGGCECRHLRPQVYDGARGSSNLSLRQGRSLMKALIFRETGIACARSRVPGLDHGPGSSSSIPACRA